MNEETKREEIIFLDGFYSDDVPDTAPEWILGKGTINIDKMVAFLLAQRTIAINGTIKYVIKMAKSGKRYVAVDTYGMQKYKEYLEKNVPQAVPEPLPEYMGTPDMGEPILNNMDHIGMSPDVDIYDATNN